MSTKDKATAVLLLVCAILVCGCRRQAAVSRSMQPTIKPGEKVTVDYTAYAVAAPKRWDVVAFEPPTFTNRMWLMRVVALPGETVSFATGGVTINGQPLVLPAHVTNVVYVSLDYFGSGHGSVISSPYVVPADSFFLLGDCSTNSYDSRIWGAVRRTNIFGKVRGK
jgi:signal peptidase I